ncbi:hypothetical protein Pden_0347 [Paracoccus denitrificans PD1222]|uniref:Uncharacterized protein n=2 Tax=Paracoccus denitrificans TaxID=266 RepID=A1AYW7_PARDP|nr:hypothetical protein Pden_0347 [Paracoccus denitrificans PD1222]
MLPRPGQPESPCWSWFFGLRIPRPVGNALPIHAEGTAMTETARLNARVEALESIVISMLQLAEDRDSDLHKHIIQRLNKAIRETDEADGIPEEDTDAEKPVALTSKCIKAIRDQFKARS